MRRTAGSCLWVATLLLLVGCDQKPKTQTNWIDASITRFHSMGWLGARAHPATRTVDAVDADGNEVAVGGMVVTEVDADGPLAKAGVTRGDVLVRVGETWLPNRDDPSQDLIRAVEAEVSAGVQPIELGVLRGGKVETLQLAHDMKPMEVGLPAASERLSEIAQAGLRSLAGLQGEDGSFRVASQTPEQSLTACSIAGLAFIVGGGQTSDSPHADALRRCRQQVEILLARDDAELGPWALAWATMFLAELSGPLEIAGGLSALPPGALLAGGGGAVPITGGGRSGPIVIRSGHGTGESAPPPGAGKRTMTYSFSVGGDSQLPEGLDINELMKQGKVQVFTSGNLPGMESFPGASAAKVEMPDEPLWTVEVLEQLADKETVERLQPLMKLVERLNSLQKEAGGWDADRDDVGYSERTLTTNQALLALGMAQRAGVPVPGAVLRCGLQFLRAKTNDGHVIAVSEKGFDRRLEAGRSSGAGAALLALNCDANDGFLRELAAYSDQHARTIPEAGSVLPLHVLNTAILRRQRGRDTWATFFEEFRALIVSVQNRDGSFAPLPSDQGGPENLRRTLTNDAVRTAIWSLIAGLQGDQAPLLITQADNPLQTKITSDGKLMGGATPTFAAGAQPMDPEQARKMLERMGIDLDEIMKNSVQTGGSDPPEDK